MAKPAGSKLRKIGATEKSHSTTSAEVKKEEPKEKAPDFGSLLEFDSGP